MGFMRWRCSARSVPSTRQSGAAMMRAVRARSSCCGLAGGSPPPPWNSWGRCSAGGRRWGGGAGAPAPRAGGRPELGAACPRGLLGALLAARCCTSGAPPLLAMRQQGCGCLGRHGLAGGRGSRLRRPASSAMRAKIGRGGCRRPPLGGARAVSIARAGSRSADRCCWRWLTAPGARSRSVQFSLLNLRAVKYGNGIAQWSQHCVDAGFPRRGCGPGKVTGTRDHLPGAGPGPAAWRSQAQCQLVGTAQSQPARCSVLLATPACSPSWPGHAWRRRRNCK